jgi:hypothetical protein
LSGTKLELETVEKGRKYLAPSGPATRSRSSSMECQRRSAAKVWQASFRSPSSTACAWLRGSGGRPQAGSPTGWCARETRELAFEAEARLRKLGVEREAEEAVLLFWKAAQQEVATVALVEQAIEALERAKPLPRGKAE